VRSMDRMHPGYSSRSIKYSGRGRLLLVIVTVIKLSTPSDSLESWTTVICSRASS